MNTKLLCAALLAVFAAAGCEKATATAPSGKRLTLYRPVDQKLQQGETSEIEILVLRVNFDDAVKVRFQDLPSGVTVLSTPPIPAGRDRGLYTLHAAPDAGIVSNAVARVTVEGPEGLAVTEMFGVTVEARKVAGN